MEAKIREDWYKEERDLFTRTCLHRNITQEQIISSAIGIEYYDYCLDCEKAL